MEQTHKITLTSGVPAAIKKLKGIHQRWLTEKGGDFKEKLHRILQDRVASVGSVTDIDEKFLKNMLDSDISKLLVEIRQFTMKHEPSFVFGWQYKSEVSNKYETYYHTEALPQDGFPTKQVQVVGEDGKLQDAAFEEYSDVLEAKDVYLTLPESGEKVRFTMLDGILSERASKMSKKKVGSSHGQLLIRNPVKFMPTSDGSKEVAVALNLDYMDYLDIEYLRGQITKREGEVKTRIIFEHPEAHLKTGSDQQASVDVLGSASFFFPSETTH